MKWMPLFVVAGLAAGILTGGALATDEYARVTVVSRATGELASAPLMAAAAPSRLTQIATGRFATGGAVRPVTLHR